MEKVFLLLGGNQGNRIENLNEAKKRIEEKIGIIIKQSPIYETEPWGFEDEVWFLNQVITLSTNLLPQELLQTIHQIEESLGRVRQSKEYSGRTIDIDILFYGDEIISEPNLIIPHQHLHKRLFTLLPLSDIDKELIHPVLQKTIGEILEICEDKTKVILLV